MHNVQSKQNAPLVYYLYAILVVILKSSINKSRFADFFYLLFYQVMLLLNKKKRNYGNRAMEELMWEKPISSPLFWWEGFFSPACAEAALLPVSLF